MSEHIVPPKTYLSVWAALLVLLGATVGFAYLPLGPIHVVAALTIAFAKAVLIALFFMHVKYKNRLVLVFVCAGLFWLSIMFALSLGDYMTRSWLPRPSAWIRFPHSMRGF